MKPLQLIAVLFSLIACLSLVSWAMTQPFMFGKVVAVPAAPQRADDSTPESEEEKPEEPADGSHPTNPFKVVQGAKKPKLEIPELEFNFNRMALGATGEHDFIIKNVGDAPAKIARGPVQCKCTVAGLKNDEIPPGGEVKIHLSWTPKDTGPFSQSATIWSDDPENSEIKLIVSGELFPEVTISPQNGWSLGPISTSEDVPLIGSIESAVFDKFAVTEIVKSSDRVQLEAIPYTKEELEGRELRSGYHLKGHLKGIDTPQPINETITVHTDLKNLPKVEFPVTGTRTGSITIIGPNWYSGRRQLTLGVLSAEKGKESKLTIMIPPADEELKLLNVTSDPAFVSVTLKPEATGKDLPRERYSLFIKIPPGSPKGVWSESKPGKLVLKTNNPVVQDLEIKLEMTLE